MELIGPSGGQIVTVDNITVTIPAGAVDAPTYIGVSAMTENALSAPIPQTFTLAAGIRLFPFNVENETDFYRMLSIGVDGIIINDPIEALEWMRLGNFSW